MAKQEQLEFKFMKEEEDKVYDIKGIPYVIGGAPLAIMAICAIAKHPEYLDFCKHFAGSVYGSF